MSLSRQFSAIGVQPRTRKPKLKRQGAVVGVRALGGAGGPPAGNLRAHAAEVKSLDLFQAVYDLNQTAMLTPLNLVAAGSTFCNRIGRRIEMKSIRISGMIRQLRTNNSADYVRLALIYDRQTNGNVPAIADILQDTRYDATNQTNSGSGANLNNRDRFVILRDLRIQLPSLTVTAGQVSTPGFQDQMSRSLNFDIFVKLKGLLTQYKADSNPPVIGDIATGSLLFITFGGHPDGNEGYAGVFTTRLRFNDA